MSAICPYLDACVIIYYVERHATLGPVVANALVPAGGHTVIPVFSDLTRLECRVHPLRHNDQDMLARYDAFFSLPDCRHVPLNAAVFDLAASLRASHGLRTPDALHLAAAIHSGCDEFWTRDKRLAEAAGGRIQVIIFQEPPSGSSHV